MGIDALRVTVTAKQGGDTPRVMFGDDDRSVSSLSTVDDTPIAQVKGPKPKPTPIKKSCLSTPIFFATLLLVVSTGTEIGRRETEMMLLGLSRDSADTLCGGILGAGLMFLAVQGVNWMKHRCQNSATRPDENSINASYGTFTAQ